MVRWLIGCSALIAIMSSGCGRTERVSQEPQLPQVTVAQPVRRQIVEWDRYTGRLAAVQSVDVRARVSGYLESIHFSEGDVVQEGQLLFVIDPRPFQAQLKIAEAQQEEARASREKAVAELRQAEAAASQAQYNFDLASTRRDRVQRLIQQNAAAAEELDLRESEFLVARAAVESAQAAIESARAGIANAEAAIISAEAAVQSAQLDLQYTQVRSPITGRASDWRVDIGNLISGGSEQATLLTTIVSLDPIHAYFDASERELLKYMRLDRAGQRPSSREAKNPVYLALADEEGLPHQGHMDFVDNRVDPNTGTMRGRAIFRNSDMQLVPGLFAELRLPGSARYEAVMIPDEAIGTDQALQYVLIVDEEDRIARRVVTTGPLSHGLRIIRSGLDGTERVVIRGLQAAANGVQVAATVEQLQVSENSELPDDYQPVPREEWLTVMPQPASAP
jgi:RND family efflux transporter MFP subunit